MALKKEKCTAIFFFCCPVILLIFCAFQVRSQEFSFQSRFVNLNGSRNYDDIKTILSDSKGFLWFGCNQGLVRFDGSNYWPFIPDSTGKSIPTDRITALYEDYKGQIWIGTSNHGIYAYSYATDTFASKNYIPAAGNNKQLSVTDIQGNGNLLFITGSNELQILDLKTEKYLHLPLNDTLQQKNITTIKCVADPIQKNRIWLLTSAGLYSSHIYTGAFKKWHNYSYSVDELNKPLKTLCITPDGTVYTASKNNGLIELLPNTGKVTIYSFSQNSTKAYSANNIDALQVYNNRFLIAGTQDRGVAAFDKQLKSFRFLKEENFPESDFYRFQTTAFAGNESHIVLATQHKGIWVSNTAAGERFKTVALSSIYNKVPGSLYARSVYAAPAKNKIYTGSYFGDGLYILNTRTGKMQSWPFIKNKPSSQTLVINHIYEDHNGIIWLASLENGLLIFDSSRQQIIPAVEKYPALVNVSSKKIYCVYEDKKYNLYIGTGDTGLAICNDRRNKVKLFTHNAQDSGSVLSNNIFAEKFFEDATGNIWISTQKGITVFQPASEKFYHFINQPGKYNSIDPAFWYAVEQDKQGYIYIGTNNGFYKIQPGAVSLQQAKHITDKQGLLHNNVYSIVKDSKDLFWITCRNGISCYNPLTGSFRNFTYRNGLPSKTLLSPMQLAEDGNIYHGAVEKFFYFNTDSLLSDRHQPRVWLTGLKIFDKDSITGLGLNTLQALQFGYRQNSFSFSFTSPSVFYPDAILYAYMLEGVDAGWKISGNRNYASYTNIKPGNYTFKVKATDAYGAWSNDIKVISINITPPLWQKWWFIITGIFLICILMYLLVRRREKNIAQREAEKTEVEKLKAVNYQYQLEIEQVIHYFASSISEQRTADNLLWDVAKNCISKLGFEDCVIYLKDEMQHVLIQKAAWGPKTTEEDKIVNPIKISYGEGIVGTVALTGKAEIIADTTVDKRYIVDDALRFSEIAVPIFNNGKVIGVIDSEHSQKNFYTQRHLQILTTISSLYADKMDKLAAEEQTKVKEIEVIKLNRDLATSQLTALRAQMNPHFIFNALNSVQQYILKGNVDEANKYLSKFSKLQREILNNSDQQFISMEKEIELLELYLQLEQLRFNGTFHYSIKMNEDADAGEIRIPPMLVQPFIENAIWHGLMPKQGERKVDICFQISDDDILKCNIRDNGIGREAAARLKQLTAGNNLHKSKGMSLVHERLQILRQQYHQPFEVCISDITDDNNNITGTLVSLTIFTGHG